MHHCSRGPVTDVIGSRADLRTLGVEQNPGPDLTKVPKGHREKASWLNLCKSSSGQRSQ